MLHGIAFDLDETLSPRDLAFARWLEAESHAASAHTLDRTRVAELDAGGRGPKEPLLAYLGQAFGWPEPDHEGRHARFVRGIAAVLTPDPGVQQLLSRLRARYPLALISNGRSRMQRAKLEKLGLHQFFDPILISEEVGMRKPDPAIFRRVAELWGCSAAEILYVGDHAQADVEGARSAGLRAVWVSAEVHWPFASAAPLRIPSVLELETVLQAV